FLTHQLGIFWGLVVNDVLCRLVAFAGTWLLLRRLSIGLRPPLLIVTLLACAFSALEFWPQSDLSVAGVPIALLALLKLRERQHPLLWCGVFVLFAYHSHFALAGVPLLLAMLGVSCWEFIRGNRHTYLPLGILTLSATYAAKSWLTTDFPTM